jgi:hypothetical protein
MLDGGLDLDIDAVRENVAEADVVTMHFPMLRKTLLVDTRTNEAARPLIRVVPMVNNSLERFESLQRMRPQLPRPDSITMIPWSRSVGALCVLQVWDVLRNRLDVCGGPAIVADADRCLDELRTLETREVSNAIHGHSYHTVWSNPELGSTPG